MNKGRRNMKMTACVTVEMADSGVVTGRNGEMPVAVLSWKEQI